jgi:hypothetical protein
MELDLISFLFGLMFIPMIFILRRKTLTEARFRRPLFLISSVVAVIGLATIPFTGQQPNFYVFLVCPLFSMTTHYLLHKWFIKKLHKEPEDTFMVWFSERDIGWDRAFNFVFLFISLSLPMFLLAILVPK